ncbi:MAG: hypothetical protein F7C38_01400 [Desulfurococcales archaeon]|nr:hypothetical protein [Desulfurococcales archaeon]
MKRLIAIVIALLALSPLSLTTGADGVDGWEGPSSQDHISWTNRLPAYVSSTILDALYPTSLEGLTSIPSILSRPPAGSPVESPETVFGRNVKVSVDYNGFLESEPSIAVNPHNTSNVVVALHQENAFSQDQLRVGIGIYYSTDGGANWTGPRLAPPGDQRNDQVLSDPALASGPSGTFYLAYLSVGERPLPAPFNNSEVLASTIMLGVSHDGGATWDFKPAVEPFDYIDITRLISVKHVIPRVILLDKEYIAAGKSPVTGDDMLVISYTEFIIGFDTANNHAFQNITIKALVSHDGGRSWKGPYSISPTITITDEDSSLHIVQGSYPAIAPNGTIYIAYYDSSRDGPFNGSASVMLSRSDDGGLHWSKPIEVARIAHELQYYYTINIGEAGIPVFRWWSSMFPVISASSNGTVYIAYSGDPDGGGCDPADVYLLYSSDYGETWRGPVRVNDDPRGSCNAQFFPWISTGPGGKAHVAWADTRLAPGRVGFDIYYASANGANVSRNMRVTDYTNPAFPVEFMGDYINLAAAKENVYIAWTDTRRSLYTPVNTPLIGLGAINTDIFIAGLGERPRAEMGLEATSIQAGRTTLLAGEASGLPAYATMAVLLDNLTIGYIMTDSQGHSSYTIPVPGLARGTYRLQLTGAVSYTIYASVRLNVTDATLDEINRVREKIDAVDYNITRQVVTINKTLGATGDEIEELRSKIEELNNSIASVLGERIEKQIQDIDAKIDSINQSIARQKGGETGTGSQSTTILELITIVNLILIIIILVRMK